MEMIQQKKFKLYWVALSAFLVLSLIFSALLMKNNEGPTGNKLTVNLDDKVAIADLTFEINSVDNTAVFVGLQTYTGSLGVYHSTKTLEIPAMINGNKVIGIDIKAPLAGDDSFLVQIEKFTAVVIPQTVETISAGALSGAINLQHLEIPFVGGTIRSVGATGSLGYIFGTTYLDYLTDASGKKYKLVLKPNPIDKNNPQAIYYYPPGLEKVILTQETKLDGYSFFGIDMIKEIVLPDSCIEFGDSVFYSCTNLETIVLPKIISNYGTRLFGECKQLKNITLPTSLTEIKYGTFFNCVELETLIIPPNVTSIGDGAFYGCRKLAMDSLYVTGGKTVNLPRGLKTIGREAFRDCYEITDMLVPPAVTSIGMGAFNACAKLNNISLPFIGQAAGNVGEEALFGYIFGKTGSLESISGGSLSPTGSSIVVQNFSSNIDNSVSNVNFYIPNSLKTVVITGESIVSYGAFQNCLMLSSVSILGDLTEIKESTFYGCKTLKTLSLPYAGITKNSGGSFGHVFGSKSYGNSYMAKQPGGKIYYIPESLVEATITNATTIYANTFYNFTKLTNVSIEDTVQSMDSSIFFGCNKLTNLKIPFVGLHRGSYSVSWPHWSYWPDVSIRNTLAWIFSSELSDETYEVGLGGSPELQGYIRRIPKALKSVNVTDDYYLGSISFTGFASLDSISISNKTTQIAGGLMSGCSSLTTLYLPFIGMDANSNSNNEARYTLGYLFGTSSYEDSYEAEGFEKYQIPKYLSRITVTGSSTTIADYAFSNFKSLQFFTTSMRVAQLGKYAFYNCNGIKTIDMPNASFTHVGDYAYYNTGTKKFEDVMPSTVTTIGAYAFGFTSISTIDFTKYTRIGDYAFINCLGLTTVNVTANVLKLGEGVFSDCKFLENVTLANEKVAKNLFKNCISLERIDLQGVSNIIPDGMFSGCISLVDFNASITTSEIGKDAFKDCKSLRFFNLPIYTETIKSGAFQNCTGLEFVTITRLVQNIEANVFDGCNEDFFIRTYKKTVDRPKTWVENWNCNFPVYVIGEDDESIFEYEYDTSLRGYIIIGVKSDVILTGRVKLPKTYNAVNVCGIGNSKLTSQKFDATRWSGVSEVIINPNYTYISPDTFKTGNEINLYFEFASTSSHDFIGSEEELLTKGRVFYQENWMYDKYDNIIYNIESYSYYFMGFATETNISFVFDGKLKVPYFNYALSPTLVFGNGVEDDISNVIFDIKYYNNLNVGTAHMTITTKDARYYGSKTIEYQITKPVLYLSLTVRNFIYTGASWEFQVSEQLNIDGLPLDANVSYSGVLQTSSKDIGTYYGIYGGVSWKTPFTISINGVNSTNNYDIDIDAVSVEIIKCDVYLEWTGGSWDPGSNVYLYPYTGSVIVPTARAMGFDSRREVEAKLEITNGKLVVKVNGVESTAKVTGYDTENCNIVANPNNSKETIEITYRVGKANLIITVHNPAYVIGEFETYWSISDWILNANKVKGLANGSVMTGKLKTTGFEKGFYSSNDGKIVWAIDDALTIMKDGFVETDYYNIILDVSIDILYNVFDYDLLIDNEKVVEKNGIIEYCGDGNEHVFSIGIKNIIGLADIIYIVGVTESTLPYRFTQLNEHGYALSVKMTKDRFEPILNREIRIRVIKSSITFKNLSKPYDGDIVNPDLFVVKKGSDQTIRYEYFKVNQDGREIAIPSSPRDIGNYRVRATAAEGSFFNPLDRKIDFEITTRKIIINFDQNKDYDGLLGIINLGGSIASDINSIMMPGDIFTGALYTNSVAAGKYTTDSGGGIYWNPEWQVRNGSTNNTQYYEIIMDGKFTINKLRIVSSSVGFSGKYDGSSRSIDVTITNPVNGTGCTIYYTMSSYYSGNDPDKQDTGSGWSRVNYSFSTPGRYNVYYKIVCPNYGTVYGSNTIYIEKGVITYTLSSTNVLFNGLPQALSVTSVYPNEAANGISYGTTSSGSTGGGGAYPVYFRGVEGIDQTYNIRININLTHYEPVTIVQGFVIRVSNLPKLDSFVTVTDYNAFYDGAFHGVEILVNAAITHEIGFAYKLTDKAGEDTTDWNYSPTSFHFKDPGIYEFYVKIASIGYQTYIKKVKVEIRGVPFVNTTVSGVNVPYDGLPHKVLVNVADPTIPTDSHQVFYSTNGVNWKTEEHLFTYTESGIYPVHVKITAYGKADYITVVDVKINKLKFTGITFNNYSGLFDGTEHTVTLSGMEAYPKAKMFFSLDGILYFESDSNSIVSRKFKDVCDLRIYIKIQGENYEEHNMPGYGTIVIEKANPSIDYTEHDVEYLGRELRSQDIKFVTIHDGIIILNFFTIDSSGFKVAQINSPKELGRYYFEANFKGTINCQENNTVKGYINIIPKTLKLIYEEKVEYTGVEQVPNITVDTGNLEKVSIILESVVGNKIVKDIGTYTFNIRMKVPNVNYVLESNTADFEITTILVDIEIIEEFEYDGVSFWSRNTGWEKYMTNAIFGHILQMSMVSNNNLKRVYTYDGENLYLHTIVINYTIVDELGTDVSHLYNVKLFIEITFLNPKLVVECLDKEVLFDGQEHNLNVIIKSSLAVNATITYSLSEENYGTVTLIGVGEYRVYFQVVSPMHEVYFGSAKLTIKKTNLVIDVEQFNETYDQKTHEVKYNVSNITNFLGTANVRYYNKLSTTEKELIKLYDDFDELNPLFLSGELSMLESGFYYAVIYFEDGGDYYSSYKIEEVKLKQVGIRFKYATPKVIVTPYNGFKVSLSLANSTYNINDLLLGHVFVSPVDQTIIRTISPNAGIYNADGHFEFQQVRINDKDGFDISRNYYPIVENLNIQIEKIPLLDALFTVENLEREYDGTIAKPLIITPSDGNINYTFTLLDENGVPIPGLLPTNYACDAGYYLVQVTIDEGTNYLAYGIIKSAYVKILPKKVEVVWENDVQTYNGNALYPNASFVDVENKSIPLNLELPFDFLVLAGSYQIRALLSDSNYTLVNDHHLFIIEQRKETVVVHKNDLFIGSLWSTTITNDDFTDFLSNHTITAELKQKEILQGTINNILYFDWTAVVLNQYGVDVTDSFEFEFDILVVLYTKNIIYEISDFITVPFTGTAVHDDLIVLNPTQGVKIQYRLDGQVAYVDSRPMFETVGTHILYIQLSCPGYTTIQIKTEIQIERGVSSFSFKESLNKEYNGVPVSIVEDIDNRNFEGKFNGTVSDLVFEFFVYGSNVPLASGRTPLNVGKYMLRVTSTADSLPGNKNYYPLYEEIIFTITPKLFNLDLTTINDFVIKTVQDGTAVWQHNGTKLQDDGINDYGSLQYKVDVSNIGRGTYNHTGIIYNSTEVFHAQNFIITWNIHDIRIADSSSPEYDITNNYYIKLKFQLTVRYKNMNVTSNNVTGQLYDGLEHKGGFTVNDPMSIAGATILYGLTPTTINNAVSLGATVPGTHTFYFKIAGITDYEDFIGTYSVNIVKGTRVVESISDVGKTYDGVKTNMPDVTFNMATRNDLPNISQWTIKYFRGGETLLQAINYGLYTFEITIPESTLYKETRVTGSFEIKIREITISGTDTMGYSGNSYVFSDLYSPSSKFTINNLVTDHIISGFISTQGFDVKTYNSDNKGVLFTGAKIIDALGNTVSSNYKIIISAIIIIEKGTIICQINSVDTVYTGSKYFVSVDVSLPLISQTRYSLDRTLWRTTHYEFQEQGTYTVYVEVDGGINYHLYQGQGTVKITPGSATIEIEDLSKVYDAIRVSDPIVKTNSSVNPSLITFQYFTAKGALMSYKPVDAGKYSVEVSVPGVPNYSANQKTFNFEITPRPLLITTNASHFIYDGTVQKPTISLNFIDNNSHGDTYVLQQISNGDIYSISYGRYSIHVSITDPNYVFNAVNVNYEIAKRDISFDLNVTKKYTNSVFTFMPHFDFEILNIQSGHTFVGNIVTKYSNVRVNPYIGEYRFGDSSLFTEFEWSNGNPIVRDNNGNDVTSNYNLLGKVKVIIDHNDIEVSLTAYSGKYDSLPHTIGVQVNLTSATPIVTYSTTLNGLYTSTPIYRTNYGFTDVYVKVEAAGYATKFVNSTISISAKETIFTIMNDNLTKIYDGLIISEPNVIYNGDQRDGNLFFEYYYLDGANYILSSRPTSVGKYKLVISMKMNLGDNYLSEMQEIFFEIKKKDLTITLKNQNKMYDLLRWQYNLTSDNSPVSGMANHHTFIGTVQSFLVDAGLYKAQSDFIWLSGWRVNDGAGNEVTSNYDLIFDIDATISKATITYDKINYEASYDGHSHGIMITNVKPITHQIKYSTDNTNFSTTEIKRTIGTTEVYFTIEAKNYEMIKDTAFIIIKPLESSIMDIMYDQVKVYDRLKYTTPIATSLSIGLQTVQYFLATDSSRLHPLPSAPTDAGFYTFVIKVASDGMYEEAQAVKTFIIEKAKLIATWTNLSFTYDGLYHKPSATVTDLAGNLIVLTVKDAKDKAGYYEATAEFNHVNYELTVDTMTNNFTISRKKLSIPNLIPNQNFLFGDEILLQDTDGKKYRVDINGNITEIIHPDGSIDNLTIFDFIISLDSNKNVGNHDYSLKIKNKDDFEWSNGALSDIMGSYTISAVTLNQANLDAYLVTINFIYEGNAITPLPIVTYTEGTNSPITLVLDVDYKVEYRNNNAVGTGIIIIKNCSSTGGNYIFTDIALYFTILASTPEVLLLNVSAKIKFVEYTRNDVDNTTEKTIVLDRTAKQSNVFLGHLYQDTTIEDIIKQFANDASKIICKEADGTAINKTDWATRIVFTGLRIELMDDSGKVIDSIESILSGDLTGDGSIDISDFVEIVNLLNGISTLDPLGALYRAGLITDDGYVDMSDFAEMVNHLNGIIIINDDYK